MNTPSADPRKTFVVGDIHGHAELLEQLIARLPIDWAADDLVFLGDYVDRGPASRRVLEYVMALQAQFPRVVALCGNHDVMMREALDDEGTFKIDCGAGDSGPLCCVELPERRVTYQHPS